MTGNTEITTAAEGRSKVFTWLRAMIPFLAILFVGTIASGVLALFAYANAADVRARDGEFLGILTLGIALSLVIGYVTARRSVESDPDRNTGPALSLLRKYRRAAAQPGADQQTGQYSIGEQYLRDLLGRRGA